MDQKPKVTKCKSEFEDNKGMIFGILVAADRSIWFGPLNGGRRFDGTTVTDFK